MVLTYSVFLVLGAAAPARAVAHNSYLRLSEYGSAVLLSGLWRPAMEAGSRSGIPRYGTEISSGTSALFYYVISTTIYTSNLLSFYLQRYKTGMITMLSNSLIRQHNAN
jgi:hypothetical protein